MTHQIIQEAWAETVETYYQIQSGKKAIVEYCQCVDSVSQNWEMKWIQTNGVDGDHPELKRWRILPWLADDYQFREGY